MEPVPLIELNVRQALGGILGKPRWWVKWADPTIRARWLDEIQVQFLRATFTQTLMEWRESRGLYMSVSGILASESRDTRNDKLAEWLRGVVTDLAFDNDDDESEEESEEEEEEEEGEEEGEDGGMNATADLALSAERARAKHLEEKLRKQESYAAVKWTLNQLALYEKLLQVPFEQWPNDETSAASDAAREVGGAELNLRATEFVRRMIQQGLTKETLRLALPVPEDPAVVGDEKIELLVMHCQRIASELKDVEEYIVQWIDLTVAQIGVGDGEAADRENHLIVSPTAVPNTFISDNAVSAALAATFIAQVRELEDVPEDEKDWHPNSNNQVLDLVHPSLYCLVHGKTRQVPEHVVFGKEFASPVVQMETIMLHASEPIPRSKFTGFQWLPTDFIVKDDGSVRIASYINNLHPGEHAALYDSIADIVKAFLPIFERVVAAKDSLPTHVFKDRMFDHESWKELPPRPKVPLPVELPPTEHPSLRSSTQQIIVKIAEIVLTPENPRYPGGSWHMEGTDAEFIVATGLYYFACDNITESRLAFRAEVTEDVPYQQSDDAGVAAMFGLFNEDLLVQTLGSVQAVEGRCLVFPNTLQHQVQPFELADTTKPGTRKILALFLVDPTKAILSTSMIPPQQKTWRADMLGPLLNGLRLVESAEENIRSMLGDGMTLEEAKKHRLELMEERAAHARTAEDDYERYFSLCEH